MVRAVIFDMDGVLLDSEPFWREAMIEEFNAVGVPMDEEACLRTQGVRIDEIVDHYYVTCPWEGTPAALTGRIVDAVERLIRSRGEMKAGVREALALCRSKEARLALATSSPEQHIRAVIETLGLEGAFEITYSAEHEPFGKPHPGVYLTAASRFGVEPRDCLAVEDSFNGLLAAKAARMKCVAIPEPKTRRDPRFCIADAVLESLEDFDAGLWARLES